jgi:hypothetical protein
MAHAVGDAARRGQGCKIIKNKFGTEEGDPT